MSAFLLSILAPGNKFMHPSTNKIGSDFRNRCLPMVVLLLMIVPVVAGLACAENSPSEKKTSENSPNEKKTSDTNNLTFLPVRNPVNTTAKNLLTEWDVTKGTNVLWTAKLGRTSYGGPVIADGKIFVGTNNERPRDPNKKGDLGVVMCFDQKSGDFLWQATHEKLKSGDNDFPRQGVASSPVVEGEYLYYVSNRCEVVKAHVDGNGKKEAKIEWAYDMIGKENVYPTFLAICSPLIVGDNVYVVTANGVDPNNHKVVNPKAPSFLAINKKTGKPVWRSNLPGTNIMEGQWTNPVFANPEGKKPQVIFPGGDGWLYSFEPKTGELLWKFDCNPKSAKFLPNNARLSNKLYFLATPVIWENKLYIGMGRNPDDGPGEGHFWCVDVTKEPKNKEKDLSPVNDNFDPKAAVNKDSGLVWHFGGKRKVPGPNGRDLYLGRTLSTACVKDGLVYLAENDGYFHCLDAKTGQNYWTHDLTAEVWATPSYADGKVFLGTIDGDVLIFEAGKKEKLLSKVEVGYPIRQPVQARGSVLYVMTDGYLYAIGKK